MKIYVSAKQSKTFEALESRQINSIAPCERHLALIINIEKSTFFPCRPSRTSNYDDWRARICFFSSNVIFGENEEQQERKKERKKRMRNELKNVDYSNLASNAGKNYYGKINEFI